jgi:hypothetical protein
MSPFPSGGRIGCHQVNLEFSVAPDLQRICGNFRMVAPAWALKRQKDFIKKRGRVSDG